MKKQAGYAVACIVVAMLSACSTTRTMDAVDVVQVWPKAPKEPRIAFVKTHSGERDFYKPSFVNFFIGAPPLSTLGGPYGIFARNENIYVPLVKDSVVAILDTKEQKISYIGRGGRGQLKGPIQVVVSASGIIYVSDPENKSVMGYDQEGVLRVLIGVNNEFVRPAGIAINDQLNRIYVVDTKDHKVKVFTLSGEKLFQFGTRGGEDGQFNFPLGVAVDTRNGNVVVVDSQNFRVQILDKDGKFLKKFGQAGDGLGSFGMPKFTAIDREGRIYITDGLMKSFQIFDPEGAPIQFIVGAEKGQKVGIFAHPGGIYVDEKDRIFLSDVTDGVVHEYQYLSDAWIKEHPVEYKKYMGLQPIETPPPSKVAQ